MHGTDQPDEPQVMIPVQVADKDIIDFIDFDPVLIELNLGSFPTVNQEILVVNFQ
jgi:hypothetical protein